MKIFVSYRSLDSHKVDVIITRLRSLKDEHNGPRFEVWQDKDSIPPGTDWWEAIVDGIIECQIFIFMISHESVKNDNCKAELNYARKRNRPIMPVVLDGEFTYNTITGKYDIDYWEQIPPELTDLRTQFLFYEGVSFVQQLERAIAHNQREPQRWRDIPAPKPPDPRLATEANSDTTTIYDQACDYAFRMELDTAEHLFQRLINADDPDFGREAHEWILILREYGRLIRLDARDNTRFQFRKFWPQYAQQFPKSFTDVFDPKDLQKRYISIVSSLPASQSEPPEPSRTQTEHPLSVSSAIVSDVLIRNNRWLLPLRWIMVGVSLLVFFIASGFILSRVVVPPSATPTPMGISQNPTATFTSTATHTPESPTPTPLPPTATFTLTATKITPSPMSPSATFTATATPTRVSPTNTPSVTPTPLLPNIVIISVVTPSTNAILDPVSKQATIPFIVKIANVGDAVAPTFQIAVSLPKGEIFAASTAAMLNPKAETEVTINVTFTQEGTQRVQIIADIGNAIVESNKLDNLTVKDMNVLMATLIPTPTSTSSSVPPAKTPVTPTLTSTTTPTVTRIPPTATFTATSTPLTPTATRVSPTATPSLTPTWTATYTLPPPTKTFGFPPTRAPRPTAPPMFPATSSAFAAPAVVTANRVWKPQESNFGGITMVLAPPGCFMMGDKSGFESDEKPAHRVCITKPFWIDKTEVTNKQYGSEGAFKGGNRPRETVSWFEAQDFCAKRGARLPTEAEWEYAARGPSGLMYPWGDMWDPSKAVFNSENTANVGSILAGASWVGAMDMSGNVWEWVNDWYDEKYYASSIENDPQGPISDVRVVRGGAWSNTYSVRLRAPNRDWNDPSSRFNNVGFRCVRDFN